MDPVARYAAVFGRPPAVLRRSVSRWNVTACMFPPLRGGFWKRLFAEALDTTVYVTLGMAAHPLPNAQTSIGKRSRRFELIAFCDGQITGGEDGSEDMPSFVLQMIAEYLIEMDLPIGIGHTLDFREPLGSNTEMSSVLFSLPAGIDGKRIGRCAGAQQLLNIVPITRQELELARSEGVIALLDALERARVRPMFDPFRKSAV